MRLWSSSASSSSGLSITNLFLGFFGLTLIDTEVVVCFLFFLALVAEKCSVKNGYFFVMRRRIAVVSVTILLCADAQHKYGSSALRS